MKMPHPELIPGWAPFTCEHDIWYFELDGLKIKIDYSLDYKHRIVIGSIAVYHWSRLITEKMPENTTYRLISLKILAWEKWIQSADSWIRFCDRYLEKNSQLLRDMDEQKRTKKKK